MARKDAAKVPPDDVGEITEVPSNKNETKSRENYCFMEIKEYTQRDIREVFSAFLRCESQVIAIRGNDNDGGKGNEMSSKGKQTQQAHAQ